MFLKFGSLYSFQSKKKRAVKLACFLNLWCCVLLCCWIVLLFLLFLAMLLAWQVTDQHRVWQRSSHPRSEMYMMVFFIIFYSFDLPDWPGPGWVVHVWLSEEYDCGDGDKAGTNHMSVLPGVTNQRSAYLAPPTTAPESICSSSLEMVATERAELWNKRSNSQKRLNIKEDYLKMNESQDIVKFK